MHVLHITKFEYFFKKSFQLIDVIVGVASSIKALEIRGKLASGDKTNLARVPLKGGWELEGKETIEIEVFMSEPNIVEDTKAARSRGVGHTWRE